MTVNTLTPKGPESGCERVALNAVCGGQPFGANGESEDNTFAHWTPDGSLKLSISNPAIEGFFKAGRKYYVDITECPEEAQK